MSNINIKHFYLNITINNKGKTGHPWSLTTESNMHSRQLTKNKTVAFLQKLVLFETGDHCNVKYKY